MYESTLPKAFHQKTLFLGEVRVIAAQPEIKHIDVIGPAGSCFYDISDNCQYKGSLEKKVALHPFKFLSKPSFYYFRAISLFIQGYKLMKKKPIHIIHAESPHISGLAATLLGKLFHVSTVIEYRASYSSLYKYRFAFIPTPIKQKVFEWICSVAFNNCQLIAANSKTYANQLQSLYPKKQVAFYNAGALPPKPLTHKDNQKVTVGFIGRLYPDKGPIYYCKAVNAQADVFRKLKVSFLLAGKGPQQQQLRQYVKLHHLEDLITFLPEIDRWEFLQQVDILVNPNIIFNALEMVNYEAAALKIPVICFGNNIYPETVIHNTTGLKVTNEDFKSMAKAIIKLSTDHKLRRSLGQGAYALYQSRYTFDQQVINLAKAYSYLLS